MDWGPILTAGVTALPAMLAWWEARKAAKLGKVNAEKIENVHGLVNGQTAKLIEVSKLAALATGEATGIEKERARTEGELKK